MNMQRIKIAVVLVVSFFILLFFKTQVFIADSPQIRPDAGKNILLLPLAVKDTTGNFLSKVIPHGSSTTDPSITPVPNTQPTLPSSDNRPTDTQQIPTQILPTTQPTVTPALITVAPPPPTITPQGNTNPPPPTPTPRPMTKVEFAQCLTSKGMKFYLNSACPFCKMQKDMFGVDAFKYISQVNCDVQAQVCRSKPGIGIGPAWETGAGKVYAGYMDLQSLGYVSSCQKPNS